MYHMTSTNFHVGTPIKASQFIHPTPIISPNNYDLKFFILTTLASWGLYTYLDPTTQYPSNM